MSKWKINVIISSCFEISELFVSIFHKICCWQSTDGSQKLPSFIVPKFLIVQVHQQKI